MKKIVLLLKDVHGRTYNFLGDQNKNLKEDITNYLTLNIECKHGKFFICKICFKINQLFINQFGKLFVFK